MNRFLLQWTGGPAARNQSLFNNQILVAIQICDFHFETIISFSHRQKFIVRKFVPNISEALAELWTNFQRGQFTSSIYIFGCKLKLSSLFCQCFWFLLLNRTSVDHQKKSAAAGQSVMSQGFSFILVKFILKLT